MRCFCFLNFKAFRISFPNFCNVQTHSEKCHCRHAPQIIFLIILDNLLNSLTSSICNWISINTIFLRKNWFFWIISLDGTDFMRDVTLFLTTAKWLFMDQICHTYQSPINLYIFQFYKKNIYKFQIPILYSMNNNSETYIHFLCIYIFCILLKNIHT